MSSISKEVIRPLFKVAIVAGEKSGDQLGEDRLQLAGSDCCDRGHRRMLPQTDRFDSDLLNRLKS